MKKKWYYASAALIVLLFLFSACQRKNAESSGTQETTTPTETIDLAETTAPTETTDSAEATETTAPTETMEPIETSSPTETDPEETTSPAGETQIPEAKVLPDTFGLARGDEDIRRDDSHYNSYYIAALDLELSWARGRGYYLYHVPGLYRGDETDPMVPLLAEFADEYILTNVKMDEEQLIRNIYAYQQPCPLDETTLMEPPYILWSFRIYHKDYLPLAKFFKSRINMSREFRLKGDYVVEMGSTRWAEEEAYGSVYMPVLSWEYEMMQAAATVDGVIQTERVKEYMANLYGYPLIIAKDEFPVNDWIRAVSDSTEGTGLEYRYFFYWEGWDPDPFSNPEDNMAQWSEKNKLPPLNADWWWRFDQAIHELADRPEEYAYPELEDLCVDGWYTDHEKDITLRAFTWAGLPLSENTPSLSEVVILLHDTENACPLYQAYIIRNGAQKLLAEGLDVTGLCDFGKVRTYASLEQTWIYGEPESNGRYENILVYDNRLYYLVARSGRDHSGEWAGSIGSVVDNAQELTENLTANFPLALNGNLYINEDGLWLHIPQKNHSQTPASEEIPGMPNGEDVVWLQDLSWLLFREEYVFLPYTLYFQGCDYYCFWAADQNPPVGGVRIGWGDTRVPGPENDLFEVFIHYHGGETIVWPPSPLVGEIIQTDDELYLHTPEGWYLLEKIPRFIIGKR